MTCFMGIKSLAALLLLPSLAWAVKTPEQHLDEIQTGIGALSKNIEQTTKAKTKLYATLKQESQIIAKLGEEIYDLGKQLKQQTKRLHILQKQQAQQLKSRRQQLQALNKELRGAHLNMQTSYLKALFNQSDITKINRISIYFRYFHHARKEQIAHINSTLQALINDQKKLTIAQQRHQQLYDMQQRKQQKLEESNLKRMATLKKLDAQLNTQSARLAALREQEQLLQSLLASLPQQKKATSASFDENKGLLPWPIKGKIVAHYGSLRNFGKMTWQGIMIDAPAGEYIAATAVGRVVFSGWLRGFGLLLIIDHGNQYMTLYSNNQALLKDVGDVVSAGEIIALSGSKLIGQYSGLYFEIRHKGVPTDPALWLVKQG